MKAAHQHVHGMVRREFLQVGFSGFLGLGLPAWIAGRAGAGTAASSTSTVTGTGRAKAVILVFQTGAPSHIDTFDMKPHAPDGIRGEFQPIDTNVAGVRICEHLPRLAARADKLAIVRTMSHRNGNHLNATHHLLTGYPQPGAFFDKIASRGDFPCYAAAHDYLRPRSDGIPSGVMLPTFLMEGPLIWPGQHAGFLGPAHDPWQIKQDPNRGGFQVESVTLPVGFSVERLSRRQGLLNELGATRDVLDARSASSPDPFAEQQRLAYSLLLSGKVARAFDLGREDPKVRDRYGRHMFGQSLLLARRLVQAGVPVVQVNMGHVQNWDTHSGNFQSLKNRLLPPTDQGVAALLDDLGATGLLGETLVVMTGEFGRTPRVGANAGNVNTRDGRDHWPNVFSAVFAGAGVRGGQTIGQSDKSGAFPATRGYSPADLAATIYHALGIELDRELVDRLGRAQRLCTGEPIAPVFSGASA